MYSFNQTKGFPISVTFFTKQRTLFQEKINSKTKFDDLFQIIQKNNQYKSQVKPKSKYLLKGKEINKNQTLEGIIEQGMYDPFCSELFLELDDLLYSGDANSLLYNKILKPKQNPFGIYVYSPKEGYLILKDFQEKLINLFELNKINEGSAYCNSNEDLYISGSNESNNKDFWIINNNDYSIKKKNMPFSKQNHSMIFLNFNQNEQWVFIVGGKDKKSFYYDLNKNYFINWGDTNEIYQNPALIQIGEYLYIFDNINSKRNYFERTKIINPLRKWEKIVPKMDKKLISNFPSNFSVSYDINGNILILGGDNITNTNNTYIYEPNNNTIIISQHGTNDNMIFADKSFYKIDNKYSIALPKNSEEKKEILIVDKNEQSLIKINTEIPNEKINKIKIKSKIVFQDKKNINKKITEGELIIKTSEIKEKDKKNLLNVNSTYNNINQQKQQFICNDCIINNDLVCQCCHKTFVKNNNLNKEYLSNEKTHNLNKNKNPTRENPYIEKIHDEYYPTLDKRYAQNKYQNRGYAQNKNVKVEIIYDEYIPIKVDYELGKPYVFKFNKTEKKDILLQNKVEEPLITDNKNIIQNDIKMNLVKGLDDKNEPLPENQDNDSLFVKSENKNLESQNMDNIKIEDNVENEQIDNDNDDNNIKEQNNDKGDFIEVSNNPPQQENLEPYINEEENVEQDNYENIEEQEHQYENENENIENGKEALYEEHYENKIEEKNEEYNEQIDEEHEHNQENNILKKSSDLNINNKEIIEEKNEREQIEVKKEIIKKDDDNNNYLTKPVLKLDFGIKEENKKPDKEDYNIIKGLKLNYEEDKDNNLLSKDSLRIDYEVPKEKEKEIEVGNENLQNDENQENHNQNLENSMEHIENDNNEVNNEENLEEHYEEMNYEYEGEEGEEGDEMHYEQAEEINFEEGGEEMHYEEENMDENDYEAQYEEQNEENDIEHENENDNEHHLGEENHEDENNEHEEQ